MAHTHFSRRRVLWGSHISHFLQKWKLAKMIIKLTYSKMTSKKTCLKLALFFVPPFCNLQVWVWGLGTKKDSIWNSSTSNSSFTVLPDSADIPPKTRSYENRKWGATCQKMTTPKIGNFAFWASFWGLNLPIGRLDRQESESGLETAWNGSK